MYFNKHKLLGLMLLSSIFGITSCNYIQGTGQKMNKENPGIDVKLMDLKVRPQDDFYNYVNGKWQKKAKIPADRASWGSFNELADRTEQNSIKILEQLLTQKYEKGSEGEKIQTLYKVYTDLDKRNKDKINPIKKDLSTIDNITNMDELQQYLIDATLHTGSNPFYAWSVHVDLKNSSQYAIYLGSVDLGLNRDFLQKDTEKNREILQKYHQYIVNIFRKIGYPTAKAKKVAESIVNFEQQIAADMWQNEELRNPYNIYNEYPIKNLNKLSKNIDLAKYLTAVGVNPKVVIVPEVKLFKNLDKYLNSENIELLKEVLKYNLTNNSASLLDEDLGKLKFEFYSKYLNGQQEDRALIKKAYSVINSSLGEAFGKLYVEKYFPAAYKAQMIELIDYLKLSYRKHIKALTWMSEPTKKRALKKIEHLSVKVGYPDKWEDYSKLKFNANASLYKNMHALSRWYYKKQLEKIGKPVDKNKWAMTPQTVNAYYNPLNNEIVFPAAILQPPFFNPKADPAVNFGGIGAVIGHEIGHAFDDSGSQYDYKGNLKDWWTKKDRDNFHALTSKLEQQFNQYEPVKGHHVNGKLTLGENLADLAGVNISFDALQMYLKDKGAIENIDNFSQNQRFFLSWATVWRTKTTEANLINQIAVDPHTPGQFRAFAPLINVEGFYQAFDIQSTDKLYKQPADRIIVW